MDELQKLMGDSYKEDLTIDDIKNFMKGKNFADLSSGNYVDKNKYNADIKNLNDKISAKDTELQSKMTDDEKAKAASNAQAAEIERLTKLLSENTITTNKSVANSSLAESLGLIGVKSDDKDLMSFIDNITTEDKERTTSVAQYVNKLIKDAYEKGKKDSTKDAMGNFGKQKGSSDNGQPEIGELGKKLAQQNGVNNKKFDYFNKN